MPNTCMKLGAELSPGGSVQSPLGLYTMTFAANGESLSVTFNNGANPPPTNFVNSWTPAAQYVKLGANGLFATTTPPTIIAPAAPPILGLDMQDNGQIVIYSTSGEQLWVWSFSSAPATIQRVAEDIAKLQGTVKQLATALKTSGKDGGDHPRKPAPSGENGNHPPNPPSK